MNYDTLFYTRMYNSYWGAITINKAVSRDYSRTREKFEFFALFQELKESHFQLGHKMYYLNKTAEEYVNSIFGNFHAEDIKADHFSKIEKHSCLSSMKDYLLKNFRQDEVPFSLKNSFEKTVMASIEFALQNGTDFFQFIPDIALKKVDPIIGGPFEHFTAYIVLNEEIIEEQHCISLTIIQMLRD